MADRDLTFSTEFNGRLVTVRIYATNAQSAVGTSTYRSGTIGGEQQGGGDTLRLVTSPSITSDPSSNTAWAVGTTPTLTNGDWEGGGYDHQETQAIAYDEGAADDDYHLLPFPIASDQVHRYPAAVSIAYDADGNELGRAYYSRSETPIPDPDALFDPAIAEWEIVDEIGDHLRTTPIFEVTIPLEGAALDDWWTRFEAGEDLLQWSASDTEATATVVHDNADRCLHVGVSDGTTPVQNGTARQVYLGQYQAFIDHSVRQPGQTWYMAPLFFRTVDGVRDTTYNPTDNRVAADNGEFSSGQRRVDQLRIRWRETEATAWDEDMPWSAMRSVSWADPPVVEEPEVPEGDVEPRMLLVRVQSQLDTTKADFPDLFTAGRLHGDAFQFMCNEAVSHDGEWRIRGHDMGNFIMRQRGRPWYRPRMIGFRGLFGAGAIFHPTDSNRIWFLSGKVYTSYRAAIHYSADRGETVTKLTNLNDELAMLWDQVKCFAIYNDVIYVMFHKRSGTRMGGSLTGGELWKIPIPASGGGTPVKVMDLPQATFNRPTELHIDDEGRGYLATWAGVHRCPNIAAATPAWTKAWCSGLPQSNQTTSMDIYGGQTRIVVAVKDGTSGIYECANGSTAFSLQRSGTFSHVALGAADTQGRRMVYAMNAYHNTGNGPAIRQLNGGWIDEGTSPARITQDNDGVNSVFTWGFRGFGFGHATRSHGFFTPDPVRPLECLGQGITWFIKTENGTHFENDNSGQGGLALRSVAWATGNEANEMYGGTQDMGLIEYKARGLWSRKYDFPAKSTLGYGYLLTHCITVLPPNAGNRAGTVIMGVGEEYTGQALCVKNPGSSSISYLSNYNKPARRAAGHREDNGLQAWCGPHITQDGGVSFALSQGGNYVVEAFDDGTNRVYGYTGDHTTDNTIIASSGFATGWSTVISGLRLFSGPAPVIAVSKHDPLRIWVKDAKSNSPHYVRMYYNGSLVSSINVGDLYTSLGGGMYGLEHIAADPLDPRYVYFTTLGVGTGAVMWRITYSSDFSSYTTANITGSGSSLAWGNRAYVDPLSGCAFWSSLGTGTFVNRAPDSWNPRVSRLRWSGNRSAGDTITIDGVSATFGTHIAIAGSLTGTIDNAVGYFNTPGRLSGLFTRRTASGEMTVYADEPEENVQMDVTSSATGAAVRKFLANRSDFYLGLPAAQYRLA